MKKFLVTLLVIILAVSVGFGIFYLVKDNEVISLKASTMYKNAGEAFEIGLDMKNPNSYTKISVSSSNENVVKIVNSQIKEKNGVAAATFRAETGGHAKIVFKTNNAKFRNIGCDVIVCDGTEEHPYRITTAAELQAIGASDESRNMHYALANNIDLGRLDGTFTPIQWLGGSLDGKGYTISNLTITEDAGSSVGLVRELRPGAFIKNVKFENAKIEATNSNQKIGVVAGVSQGTIQLVEIKSASITGTNDSALVGGAVGHSVSVNEASKRVIARVDRVSANITLGVEGTDLRGKVGGLVGKNEGGIIINSYVVGKAYVKNAVQFGGIVATNEYKSINGTGGVYSGALGGNIKDCYTNIDIHAIVTNKMGYILVKNTDHSTKVNKIVGNYYVAKEGGLKGMLTSDITGGAFNENGTTSAITGETNILTSGLMGLVSYNYYDQKVEINDGKAEIVYVETTKKTIYWDSKVWKLDANQNNGYPILTFEDEYVNDNFENSSALDLIDNVADLEEIRNNLSGSFVISGDIDLDGQEWTPIGTEDKPFTGKVVVDNSHASSGITISNLKVTSGTYAGFFGVLGDGAYIKGINLNGVTISGVKYAGGIAGRNYGTIINCNINNGSISASVAAGGIVGYNNGEVIDSKAHATSSNKVTISRVSSDNDLGYGAIAGANYGTLNGVQTLGNILVTSTTVAKLGGIVGSNMSMVQNSVVELSQDEDKYGIIATDIAYIGGIAGYSEGTINTAYVSAIISANASKDSYAGGIVGKLKASKTLAVNTCVVNNSIIRAHFVGGAIGDLDVQYVNKLDVKKKDFNFDGAQYVEIGAEVEPTATKIAVESGVTLKGENSGGIVCYMEKGILNNSYSKVTLAANRNAGIVYAINFYSDSCEGGVIFDVYSTSKHSSGTSYGVSTSEVHNNWNLVSVLGESSDSRNVGFIYDYYYEQNSNLINPQSPNPIKGLLELFGQAQNITYYRTSEQMQSADLWSFFSDIIWTKGGGLPSIKDCAAIMR